MGWRVRFDSRDRVLQEWVEGHRFAIQSTKSRPSFTGSADFTWRYFRSRVRYLVWIPAQVHVFAYIYNKIEGSSYYRVCCCAYADVCWSAIGEPASPGYSINHSERYSN
jgi:hypothetical protein